MSLDETVSYAPVGPLPPCRNWEAWCKCFRSAPPTLNTLRRAFTLLLRYAFSDPARFDGYSDTLSCLTYSDDSDSQLSIDVGTKNDSGDTENVPGIDVSMGEGVTYDTISMDYPITSMAPNFAEAEMSMLATVPVTITCRHYSADICCAMADMCILFLFSVQRRLFNAWGWLRQYKVKQQTEPKLTTKGEDTTTKWYESAVTLELMYEYGTTVVEESKLLKDWTHVPTRYAARMATGPVS